MHSTTSSLQKKKSHIITWLSLIWVCNLARRVELSSFGNLFAAWLNAELFSCICLALHSTNHLVLRLTLNNVNESIYTPLANISRYVLFLVLLFPASTLLIPFCLHISVVLVQVQLSWAKSLTCAWIKGILLSCPQLLLSVPVISTSETESSIHHHLHPTFDSSRNYIPIHATFSHWTF